MGGTQPAPVPGDWCVVRIPGPQGEAIEWMQRLSGGGHRASEWVHAAYLVETGWVVEATPHGMIRSPLSRYPPEILWWSTGTITKDAHARSVSILAAEALAEGHTGYSYLDYLAIAAHSWHIPLPGLRAYIQATGHMICSQLVDYVELCGGTHLYSDGRWPGYVRPLDLADLIGAP